ncbi:General stress protein 39 [subsurface metagenome]
MSKIILVTGASKGIGAATAKMLAPGNDLIIHYNLSKDSAVRVAQEVKNNGGNPFLLQADLTTEDACIEFIEKVKKNFSNLDVLVNNAGGEMKRQNTNHLSWKNMIDTFNLNAFSVMKMSSLSIDLLEKSNNDPTIINVSSLAIRLGAPSSIIYGASKGAIDSFTRGLARALAPEIRVNAVAPGVINTPLLRRFSTPEIVTDVWNF